MEIGVLDRFEKVGISIAGALFGLAGFLKISESVRRVKCWWKRCRAR